MISILTIMVKFRNVCAHGERLFTYRTTDSIPDLPIHMKLGIDKKKHDSIEQIDTRENGGRRDG